MYTEITKCGKCPFYFIGPITKFTRCLLSNHSTVSADNECFFENGTVEIDNDVARGILTCHNEWRRGADCLQMSPRLLGMAIDYAIMKLKNT